MKYIVSVILLLGFNLQAQIKVYNYDKPLTCDDISNGITDSILYEVRNNRLYIKPDEWRNNKMKKLVVNNKFYYISDKLATIITKIVQENNCSGIIIKEMDIPQNIQVIRD